MHSPITFVDPNRGGALFQPDGLSDSYGCSQHGFGLCAGIRTAASHLGSTNAKKAQGCDMWHFSIRKHVSLHQCRCLHSFKDLPPPRATAASIVRLVYVVHFDTFDITCMYPLLVGPPCYLQQTILITHSHLL